MSRRMNWAAANDRAHIRQHGAETVAGHAIGAAHRLPSAAQEHPLPRPRGPKLDAPLKIDSFWANRVHDAIVVTFSTFKNHNMVDVRKHAMNAAGQLVPTPKGFALKVTRLRDLQKAIDKAVRKACELGLVAEDGE
jgi:Transcriptional Coactivator p15 (PC4)